MIADFSNHIFQMAVQFVNQTNRHVFLTGKAGTGKTTFLKYIKENSFKKTAVVAPTGVAAINAGGVTMHSFFQLPFGPFIPTVRSGWNSAEGNQHTLFKNIRFNREKRELIGELELLIIDEVSMVRADMLDAVDTILRHFRQQPLIPFGGVQLLYIGDLFQLPPVVKSDEWENLLSLYYKSPFFFDALVTREAPPVLIELKKIYRQNEPSFISILNNIRDNNASPEDLMHLDQHFKPGYEPPDQDHYITLTTHNNKARDINENKLKKLSGRLFSFPAAITGDFNENALPADSELRLKPGTQIMFLKNDKGEFRRYYNGKIGSISKMENDKIYVRFPGEKNEMEVEKEKWKNIRYTYNKEKDQIEEEELGTFTQYPIRLAWAITIHKSQGLTFDRAIIDAGDSFAPGQVYVALSRLTSLKGLVLYSKIQPQAIHTDTRVLAFLKDEMGDDLLAQELSQQQRAFISGSLLESFSWEKLVKHAVGHVEEYEHRLIPDKEAAIAWANEVQAAVLQQQQWAVKFTRQLEQLFESANVEGYKRLHSRVGAAVDYFEKSMQGVYLLLQGHIREVKIKQRIKKYLEDLYDLETAFKRKGKQLEHAAQLAEALMSGGDSGRLLQLIEDQKKSKPARDGQGDENPRSKSKKGETKFFSLELFKQGTKVDAIAKTRGLTASTIEGHLISFLITGDVKIEEIVSKNKIENILRAINQNPESSSSFLKEKLGTEYSFNDIKAVMIWKAMPANAGK